MEVDASIVAAVLVNCNVTIMLASGTSKSRKHVLYRALTVAVDFTPVRMW